MKCEHKRIITKRKEMAEFRRVFRVYSNFTTQLNDCQVVVKMIQEYKISEKNIKRAITAYSSNGEYHARVCIFEARKKIYGGNQKDYAPLVILTCGNDATWKQVVGKIDIGELAYCNKCKKLEAIVRF